MRSNCLKEANGPYCVGSLVMYAVLLVQPYSHDLETRSRGDSFDVILKQKEMKELSNIVW